MSSLVPKVSVISQVYNQSEWMKEMIQSVINQSFRNWEHLIVDDGSTEDLKAVVDSFKDERIKLIRFDENRGVPHGMNHAFSLARGKYICMIAADEVFDKDKLKEQVRYMEENEAVDCCWGLGGSPSQGGEYPLGLRPEWEQYAMGAHNRSNEAWLRTLVQLENVPLGGCGLMMKRAVLEEIGYFNTDLVVFSDHELYCRFFAKGKKAVVVPYRFSVDKPARLDSVRVKNFEKGKAEYEVVKSLHPLQIPVVNGTVTVGIPCYNHAKFLKDAVDSILAQTYAPVEIMIMDDCSTDDFKTVVQQFTDPRIKVMAFDENRGVQEAMNQMAFRAKGDFFLPLSADDTLDPTYIAKAMAEFAKDPWCEFVSSQTDFMDEAMKPLPPKSHPFQDITGVWNMPREEWIASLHGGNRYFGAGIYRTKALSEVGGWEKKYKVISDYQMYLKILHRGDNIRIIEEPLTHTRVHGKNNSMLNPKQAEELPWLYHAARKPFYRKLMKVVIATPFYEVKAFSPYVTSLMATARLMHALGIDYRFLELSGDSYVHRARNTLADMFLRDPDATDLFFVDSDMSWDPEAFVKMCILPDDVVGGAYPVKNNWGAWTSIPKITDGANDSIKHLQGRNIGDGNSLIEARVLAGGFIRIKRSVLERFREHHVNDWYVEPSTDPENPEHKFTKFFAAEQIEHRFFGEDHYFAKKLTDMGIRTFIYPNVNIVHWGTKDFAGNYDLFLKKEFNESKAVAVPMPVKAAA